MMRKTINTKVLTVAIVSIVLLLCQLKVSNGEGFCMTMADTGEQTCLNIVDQKSDEIIPKGANALGKPREVEKACIDRHQQCIAFAKQGECQKTPGKIVYDSNF